MALKQIMLRKKIDMKRSELNQLISKDADFATREAALEAAIGEAKTEEEQTAVTEQVEAFETTKKETEEAKTALEE